MLGGIRLDGLADGFPLPSQAALQPFLSTSDLERCVTAPAEISGMWSVPREPSSLRDVSTLLLGAGVAAALRLGLGALLGLPHQKTFGILWSYGFQPVTEIGDGGRFSYPDERYVSTLCRLDLPGPEGVAHEKRSWVTGLAQGQRLSVPAVRGKATVQLQLADAPGPPDGPS